MGHRFAEIAFTDSVKEVQQTLGSRTGYALMEEGENYNDQLSDREIEFVKARDSFYMASVSETGWPYVQHRGGPPGFIRVLDGRTLGFVDFKGNRQYVTVGNVRKDDRVSLFLMDYPNRLRLKLLGRVELVGPEDSERLAKLEVGSYRARVERGFVIHIEAFDWNCPQHITPRYTESEVEKLLAPLVEENHALKSGVKALPSQRPTVLGEGPIEVVISGMRQLTPRIRAYELRTTEGAELPAASAGAHIQVPASLSNGKSEIRHYSISSNPNRRDMYEIAVLREDQGNGGSRAVHEHFNLGLGLRITEPRNNFSLHSGKRPAVLIAGGIGITPIKAMAAALKADGRRFHLHYAGRSLREMAYVKELVDAYEGDISIYPADIGKRLDTKKIMTSAPADAVFYVCGPERLIDGVVQTAAVLEIEAGRIRFERFSAADLLKGNAVEVELRRSNKLLQVSEDQSVLEAVHAAGVRAPFDCGAGNCKTCAVRVLEGIPEHRDSALSDAERERGKLMCICVSRAKTDRLVLDL